MMMSMTSLEPTKAEPYQLPEGMTMEEVARCVLKEEDLCFLSQPVYPLQRVVNSGRVRNMMTDGVTVD